MKLRPNPQKHFWTIGLLFSCLALPPVSTHAQSSREILRLGRGTANALDWRPDGKVLAVGGGTGVWLYDEKFETLAHFEGSSVYPVQWSPSGDRLAFADEDGVHIWSMAEDGKSGKELLSLEGADLSSLAWSPDGKRIAVGSYEDAINVWNTQNGDLLLNLPDAIWEAAWSPDGSKLASPSADNYAIHIWNAENGELQQTLKGVEDSLYWSSVAWSPDGKKVAGVSSLPASLHVWNMESGELINEPDTSDDMYSYRQVLWDWRFNVLAAISSSVSPPSSTEISIWDITTWQTENIAGTWEGIKQIDLYPGGGKFTSLDWDGTISDWDATTLEVLRSNQFHIPSQYHMAWSPDNNQLATSLSWADGYPVLIWVLSANDLEHPSVTLVGDVVQGLPWTYITSLTWTANDELVTTSENEPINYIFRSVERWDTKTGKSEGVIFRSEGGCGTYGWNSDFALVACTDYNYTEIAVRQISTDKVLFSIPVNEFIAQIAWSPDSTALGIINRNLTTETASLQMWNTRTGKLTYAVDSLGWRSQLRWSPDSAKIALRIFDAGETAAKILDASSGETQFEVSGTPTWSPDSRLLGVAQTNSVTFYEARTGEVVATAAINGLSGALAWSPDGTMLALGMSDGTIRIWDVSDIRNN